MTTTLDLPPDMESLLFQASLSEGKDISTLLLDSARHHLQGRGGDVLSGPETELLQRINAPLASEARTRRDALLTLQAQRELTRDEQTELTRVIDAVEVANAEHWQAIAELARRRGLSLHEIAAELQIPLT